MKFATFVGIGQLRGDGGYRFYQGLGRWRRRRWGGLSLVVESIDMVFDAHPRDESDAKSKIEEAFVGDGKDDESWGKSEKDDDEPVKVVIIWLHTVDEGYRERCDYIRLAWKVTLGAQTHLARANL